MYEHQTVFTDLRPVLRGYAVGFRQLLPQVYQVIR